MGVLILLILFIIVIGPLWAGQAKLGESIQKGERVKACQISITKAGQFKQIPTAAGETNVDINCPRGTYTLKYEDIKGEGKEIDQEKLNLILAQQIEKGWQFIAYGKYFPWSDYNADEGFEYKSACLVWTTIEFDNELKEYLKLNNMNGLEYDLDSLAFTYPTKEQAKPYSEIIFGEEPLLQARVKAKDGYLDNDRKIIIDDGTKIMGRVNVGDMNNEILGIRPINKVLILAGDDSGSTFFWHMYLLGSAVSYSAFGEEYNGREYRICDQIKN